MADFKNAEVLIKFTGDTDNVDEAQKKVSDGFKDLQRKGEVAFAGLTAAADAFAVSILKSGIQYNAEIETYLTRLTTLTGSAEEANKILTQIKKDALATPFEVSSLTQAESLLLSTGLSAEQSRADILALGDAIAASGGGNEELQRMAVNLQQIKNVGKASALDIKQFAYAGVDIYGLLADSMGITRAQASKLDVTYDMLSKALQKASQKGGKYYGAMEKQSKTYSGAMSNLKEAIQVFNGELSKGLFNTIKKIIPELSKFFNWMTKNKDLIIMIVAPTLAFLNVFAGFIAFSKMTGLVKAFYAALAAHPFAAAVAGITAITVALISWANQETALDKAHKKEMDALNKQKEAIDNNVKSWNDLKEAQQQQIDVGMTELSHEGALYDELKNITNENGKVKKGYEDRAKFITGELSKSLGVEIKLQDGVIQNYKNIQKEIEKTMEKKKAQIQLEAQEELYKEAVKEQAKAQRDLADMKDKVADKTIEVSNAEKEWQEKGSLASLKKLEYSKKELKKLKSNYNKQEDLVEEYYYNIAEYQENYEKFQKKQYDKMSYNDWSYAKKYKNASDSKKAELQDQIAYEKAHIQKLEEMNVKSGNDKYAQQLKDAKKRLTAYQDELKQYKITTQEGMKETQHAWDTGLANQLTSISNRKVEFKKTTSGLVQAYVDGVKIGEPIAEKEMETLGNKLIAKANSKKSDAKNAGKNIIDGLSSGISDKKAQENALRLAKKLSNDIVKIMKTTLGIHSPSKITLDMGVNLLKGFTKGINKEENKLFDRINGLSNGLIGNLDLNTSLSNSTMATMNNAKGSTVVNVYANFKQDNLGQMVRDIKTFSGGARNDFNYGAGV